MSSCMRLKKFRTVLPPPVPFVRKKSVTPKPDKVDSETDATANLGNAACSDKVKS